MSDARTSQLETADGDPCFYRMRAALNALPKWQRQAFLLKRISAWKDEEIAAKLHRTPVEVRAGIVEALGKLTEAIYQ